MAVAVYSSMYIDAEYKVVLDKCKIGRTWLHTHTNGSMVVAVYSSML